MRKTLSDYKFKKLALESLRNSLRLLRDAIALYRDGSYPTAYQLAVLAIEELSKARWVDHVYYSACTNERRQHEDVEFEQQWLRMLYSHESKHRAFLRFEPWDFSPKLTATINSGELDRRKQAATYVSLPRRGKLIDVNGRISLPQSITRKESKSVISLFVREVKDICKLIVRNDSYFWIESLNEVLSTHEVAFVFSWRHASGLKSKRYAPSNRAKVAR